MEDFLKSKRLKVLLVVMTLLFSFLLRSIYTGGFMPFLSGLGDLMLAPAGQLAASAYNSLEERFYPFFHAREILEENQQLREENRQLEERLIDYQSLKNENEQFREFLEIKEENKSFVFQPANVIGRSPDSHFGAFTINVGRSQGVSPRDAVITADGLVGIVTEVSHSFAKVQTILDVSVSIGGVDIYTLDTGVVGGTIALASQGQCKMGFLPRESGAAPGDIINTSGIGGQLPAGLKIGTIQRVETETSGLSLYAVIQPSADIFGVKTVQVITSFDGEEDAGQVID